MFDGATYDPGRDGARLTGALERVRAFMADHQWHTLRDVAAVAGCSESAASARLRDLRKWRFGSYTIQRKHVTGGMHVYRMAPDDRA